MSDAVLITGASTGIGFDGAVSLAKSGKEVYAGVRSQKDGDKLLEECSQIHVVILDVTNSSQIEEAYKKISAKDYSTFSLVNNAGIAITGPIETLPMSELRKQMDVNFFGLIEVTQKFLPLIRKSHGRIVNISSVSGLASSPFLGAYSASKFAVEAISDSLRWELSKAGVKVVIIEPGPIQTPIWNKNFTRKDEIEEQISLDRLPYYKSALLKFAGVAKKMQTNAKPVKEVSEAIHLALNSNNPPVRIIVADWQTKVQTRMQNYLPTKWVDRTMQKILFR